MNTVDMKKTHMFNYKNSWDRSVVTKCGVWDVDNLNELNITKDPNLVTCLNCLKTKKCDKCNGMGKKW